MKQNLIEKATEIVSVKNMDCVLALINSAGYPTVSAITMARNDGIKWIAFCTRTQSNKVERIKECNKASVCVYSVFPLYNISLVGRIEIRTDIEIKKKMWYEECRYHWDGPDDKDLCVLKFTTERYNLMIDYEEEVGTFDS